MENLLSVLALKSSHARAMGVLLLALLDQNLISYFVKNNAEQTY